MTKDFRTSPMASSRASFTRRPCRRAKISVVITDRGSSSSARNSCGAGWRRPSANSTRSYSRKARSRRMSTPSTRTASAGAPPARAMRVALDHRAHVAEVPQPTQGAEPVLVDAAGAHDLERGGTGHGVERQREAAHRAVIGEPDRQHDRDAERDAGHRQRRSELLLAQAAENELPKERHGCVPAGGRRSSTRRT